MATEIIEPAIKVGQRFEQFARFQDGSSKVRVIEFIGRPTLSSPVNYLIIRNDAHPHRAGKTASIRRADLHRKYRAVSR
ncbi:hypothetical protein [Microbacterium sp. 77mftsu3.1]|uniref:hypothetical protein n=1 Tax=Microbacterium sp. 77mftsu3.1 TaxID=1761802 RepID=UPI00036D27C4|nr:hypothetical protein [Microbacterium sp. 77mftsu3.1]SDG23083.1 hypothetical protein SAMN04488590_0259 [Microbacterium sp. 77mftsu3.1]